jgi:hypothetical protein
MDRQTSESTRPAAVHHVPVALGGPVAAKQNVLQGDMQIVPRLGILRDLGESHGPGLGLKAFASAIRRLGVPCWLEFELTPGDCSCRDTRTEDALVAYSHCK